MFVVTKNYLKGKTFACANKTSTLTLQFLARCLPFRRMHNTPTSEKQL